MTDFTVSREFAEAANPSQLHQEAATREVWPASFVWSAQVVYRVDVDLTDDEQDHVQDAIDNHQPRPSEPTQDELDRQALRDELAAIRHRAAEIETLLVISTPWRRPGGAQDAYPMGARVVWEGDVYVSQHPSNVWRPDEGLWILADGIPEPSPGDPLEYPLWVQPQPGVTDPYMTGDRVTHNRRVWESLVVSNWWRPGDPGTEALWKPL